MKNFKSIQLLRKEIARFKRKGLSIGFVPTMGALHDGHLSLVDKSRRENDITVLSIFVNPAQFGPKEDFKKYPREEKSDVFLAKKRNVDIIFCPTEKIMYPSSFLTFVQVNELGSHLCGNARPGHFLGVTTIVIKLLNIVMPDRLYLGQKDIQQAVIINQMINDLNVNVKTRLCPIVREKDGLAMSSRNIYLSKQQRIEASVIYQSLRLAKQAITNGERRLGKLKLLIKRTIKQKSGAHIEYIECVDTNRLKKVTRINGKVIIALAVRFGTTRLIDNIIINH